MKEVLKQILNNRHDNRVAHFTVTGVTNIRHIQYKGFKCIKPKVPQASYLFAGYVKLQIIKSKISPSIYLSTYLTIMCCQQPFVEL